jgi:hypothetical protein
MTPVYNDKYIPFHEVIHEFDYIAVCLKSILIVYICIFHTVVLFQRLAGIYCQTQHVGNSETRYIGDMFRLTLWPSSGLTQTSNELELLHLGVGDTYSPHLLLKSWLKVVVIILVIIRLRITMK